MQERQKALFVPIKPVEEFSTLIRQLDAIDVSGAKDIGNIQEKKLL